MTTTRIQQIYGYLVCLIAIITILFSATALMNALFDLSRPEGVTRYGGLIMDETGSSFEEYRLSRIERVTLLQEKSQRGGVIPDDSTLRREFEERRSRSIAAEKWQSQKSLATSSLSLLIGIILFLIHWKWLKSIANRREEAV